MSKVIVVFDLGPGDGGKGGIVHKLSCHHNADIILKVGGAQGNHGVSTGTQSFAFSQWGCGTLEGVKTHITPLMVVSPDGLLNEAAALKEAGIISPFDMLTIDEYAVCATPYHGIASRLKEMYRKTNPRGTIGTGVGEAHRKALSNPELTIRASDLTSDLRAALIRVRNHYVDDLHELLRGEFSPLDQQAANTEINLLFDGGFLDYNVDRFKEAGRNVRITGDSYLKHSIFDQNKTAIVESSHGILTDNEYGFWPYVSAIRTLPSFTHYMLRYSGYNGKIETIGVHRAYTIRHGAGPMPTADVAMNDSLLPGSCKLENRYQGRVRVGPLDLVLLRYALEVCKPSIDALAISWFDQVSLNGSWDICNEYGNVNMDYFHSPERIRINEGSDRPTYRSGLCAALFAVKPIVSSIAVPNSIEEQYRLCDRVLCEKLGVPVHIVSFGSTPRDKVIRSYS